MIIMTIARGYSLWLMPSDMHIKNLISQLSEKNASPFFEPHVTLLGEVAGGEDDILSKTLKLSSEINAFRIELGKVEYLAEYFRCLFSRAKETKELIRANQSARQIFNREKDHRFMPHLSLMYGNFSATIKQKIISEIGKNINTIFEAKSINLFHTEGAPKDWHKVKEFPFSR